MILDNSVGDCESKARALTHVFRREERIEDLVTHLRVDPGAGVHDLYLHEGSLIHPDQMGLDAGRQAAGAPHGVDRIRVEVDEDLKQLLSISPGEWGCRRTDRFDDQ